MANSKLDNLEVIVGTVVDVQIIERQMEQPRPPAGEAEGKQKGAAEPPPTATIIGRQRVFLDGPGVKDPHFDFDRCELAMRNGQEIAFARVPARGKKSAPVNVMLLNRTMGESWAFAPGMTALAPPPLLEVRTKALIFAIASFVALFLIVRFLVLPQSNALMWITWSLIGALVLYFVFWGGLLLYRAPAQKTRRRKLAEEVQALLKAAPSPAPATIAAPAPPATAAVAASPPPLQTPVAAPAPPPPATTAAAPSPPPVQAEPQPAQAQPEPAPPVPPPG